MSTLLILVDRLCFNRHKIDYTSRLSRRPEAERSRRFGAHVIVPDAIRNVTQLVTAG